MVVYKAKVGIYSRIDGKSGTKSCLFSTVQACGKFANCNYMYCNHLRPTSDNVSYVVLALFRCRLQPLAGLSLPPIMGGAVRPN